MKPSPFILTLLVLCLACKKEKEMVPPSPETPQIPQPSLSSIHTKKMDKTYAFYGVSIYRQHPPNQDPDLTYTDTTIYNGAQRKIDVINDTTIKFGSELFIYTEADTVVGIMTFEIKPIHPSRNRFVKYFYNKDSVWHRLYEGYVSRTWDINMYTK